jgi:hypothetical protein
LARLFLRGYSREARAVLEEPQFVAPKWLGLLYFLLKNGSSKKMFSKLLRRS